MADIDPAAFLWPAFLHDTSRRASRAWLKFERVLEKKGNWHDALADVEMMSVLKISEPICVQPPDAQKVYWQPYVVGDPDSRGVGRTHYIELELRKRLTVEGFDFLWFVVGQLSLPWYRHDWQCDAYRALFSKAVHWIPAVQLIEDRLITWAMGDSVGKDGTCAWYLALEVLCRYAYPELWLSVPDATGKLTGVGRLVEYGFISATGDGEYEVVA